MRKFTLFLFIGFFLSASAFAQQNNFWSAAEGASEARALLTASQKPSNYKIFQLDHAVFARTMQQAPSEKNVSASRSAFIISFPMPDGSMERFRIVDAPVMHPALAARYPGINAYAGQGIDDPSMNIRFDVSRTAMNAVIHSSKRPTIYIDHINGEYYRVASRADIMNYRSHFQCYTEDVPPPPIENTNRTENVTDGKLRTYRLAMLSGAEFSNHFIPLALPTLNDSIAAVLAAQNSHVVRMNAVYERDFGVRMQLVPNNDLIIYFVPSLDPIANPNNPNGITLHNTITSIIGSGNFDIGHTESKGVDNGNAGCIGCVCNDGSKGRGWTVYSNPSLLEFFVIDYLAHEVGHQFGANHTHSYQRKYFQLPRL